jgi:hypothetical protein
MLSKLLAPSDEQVTLTPWGAPQHITKLAEDIQRVSTASHGGIKLSAERNEQIPKYMRNADGWYEEDEQWAIVAVVFPDAFPSGTDVDAYGTLKNWHPDAYEKFTGRALKPGDSYVRDRQTFQREHANSLIVTSAYGAWAPWVPKGFVGCLCGWPGRARADHGRGPRISGAGSGVRRALTTWFRHRSGEAPGSSLPHPHTVALATRSSATESGFPRSLINRTTASSNSGIILLMKTPRSGFVDRWILPEVRSDGICFTSSSKLIPRNGFAFEGFHLRPPGHYLVV